MQFNYIHEDHALKWIIAGIKKTKNRFFSTKSDTIQINHFCESVVIGKLWR